jgi:hypothetical protein
MKTENIKNEISKDIKSEFEKIKEDFFLHYDSSSNINQLKEFLISHIPNELIYRADILLDLVINHLMQQARKEIENTDATFQNKFYEYDFRTKIKDWAKNPSNSFKFTESQQMQYSTDPRVKNGVIFSSSVFVAGAAITSIVFLPKMILGAVIAGVATIVLSSVTFKVAFNKTAPKAKELIKTDVFNFIDYVSDIVEQWLFTIIDRFDKDFEEFCQDNKPQ